MRNIIRTYKANIVNNQKISASNNSARSSADLIENNPFSENLTIEGCELRSNSSASQNRNWFDDQENGFVSHTPYITMLFSMMDSWSSKFISRRGVLELLERRGFKMPYMKGINAHNYIRYKKVTQIINNYRTSNHSLQPLSLINI